MTLATNVASAATTNRNFEIPLALVTRMVNACQAAEANLAVLRAHIKELFEE